MFVDAHLDLAYNALQGRDITLSASQQPELNYGKATVGLPDLRRGGALLICATVFAEPRSVNSPEGYATAEEAQVIAWQQAEYYLSLLKSRQIDFVTEPGEISDVPASDGAVPAVLLMEGADPIVTPGDLKMWFDLGLRVVGLAWRQTRYAGGTGVPGPLTADGRELVKRLDELGIIHDTSHLAEEAFWQLMDLTAGRKGGVFASHSNCRSFVPTDRQLSDEMIKAIAARDGVIGINLFDKFLLPPDQYGKRRATLGDVIAHIQHICQLTGSVRHVGLGTDMDGGLGLETIPQEVVTSADLPKVGEAMRAAGFTDEDARAVVYGNFLRFFRENLAGSQG